MIFTALTWLANSRIGQLIGLAVAALAALKLAKFKGKREGRREAIEDAQEADHNRATEIRDGAEIVRRRHDGMSDGDVDEWLSSHPARRDAD